MTVFYFLIAVLVIAALIAIHELGHYTAGRLLGFKILDYSIGFGPAIFKIKKKDITYALRAIPLGGSCRFYGETELEDGEAVDPEAIPFNSQKTWKRLIVYFAGPLMNILLAYLLSVLMMVCFGDQKIRTYPNGAYAVSIVDIRENSPADIAGLEKGDLIAAVNGRDITDTSLSFQDRTDIISKAIDSYKEGVFGITVIRGEEELELTATGLYNENEGKNLLGVTMGAEEYFQPERFFPAWKRGAEFVVSIVRDTFKALAGGIKNGFNEGELTGIVGTFAITVKMAEKGVYYVLLIAVLLSMSLGIMNLLPILPLDGGHLLFDFIELIIGKPVPRKIQNILSVIGFLLLIALMIYVTVGDVKGLINGLFDF